MLRLQRSNRKRPAEVYRLQHRHLVEIEKFRIQRYSYMLTNPDILSGVPLVVNAPGHHDEVYALYWSPTGGSVAKTVPSKSGSTRCSCRQ